MAYKKSSSSQTELSKEEMLLKIQNLQTLLDKKSKQLQRMRTRDLRLNDLVEKQEQEIEDLDELFEGKLNDLEEKHTKEIEDVEQSHEKELKKLEKKHDKELKKLEREFSDIFSDEEDNPEEVEDDSSTDESGQE